MRVVELKQLGEEIDDVTRQYETHFAGQSRATRSLPMLDRLIARLGDVIAHLPEGVTGEAARLRQAAQERKAAYERERTAVQAAQEAGPDFQESADLASFANQVFSRYQRHFAGQPRMTRDAALLREMIAELKGIQAAMTALCDRGRAGLVGDDLKVVERNLYMYEQELSAVERAQAEGSPEERANALAALANGQFQVYRVHFAGRARLGRRPQLLERVIGSLRDIEARMGALTAGGLRIDWNERNREIVRQNLARYEAELAAIRQARMETDLADLLSHLGAEANEAFDEYGEHFAGKDRSRVELQRLGEICDRLGEIARQMRDLLRAAPSDVARENLDVVLGQLGTFEEEWTQVQRRQQKPPSI